MKSFLDTWLAGVTEFLHRKLSMSAELVPAEALPSPSAAVILAISRPDNAGDRFTVVAELSPLHSLLLEAGLAGSEPDSLRDHESWRELLKEVTAAALSLDAVEDALVHEAHWPSTSSLAAYELRLGEVKLLLAFASEAGNTDTPVFEQPESAANVGSQPKGAQPGIDLLLDVELEVSLRFGSCELSLNEVLELGPGDVVELDRHIADPVDLLVGDKIVARGEVVLVNGNFGLRVLEVAEPRRRLESIRCLF